MRRLRRIIPDALEPWLVLCLVVGLFVSDWFFAGPADGKPARFDNLAAGTTLAIEGVFALVLGFWLWRRGWRSDALSTPSEPLDVARGVLLWLGALLVAELCFQTVALANHGLAKSLEADVLTIVARRPLLAVFAIGNAVFEEFLWLAYGVTALSRRMGLARACAVSIALRTAIHAYQGALAIVGILPVGLVFTAYYARTRRVWPVIVAHALQDALAFAILTSANRPGS